MKSLSSLILPGCAALLAATGVSEAVTYSFTGYTLGNMNGQGGWSVDNSASKQPATILSLSGPWGGRAASIGFVVPTEQTSVFVSNTVSTPMSLAGASFSARFQVQDSDSGYGSGAEIRDTFGFRLENTVGDNLFSFLLTPFDQDPTPESDTAFHTFSWSTGAGAPTVVLNSPLVSAEETFAYTFSIDFFNAGGGNIGFNADVNGDGFSGTLTGLGGQSIKEFGALWNLEDTTFYDLAGTEDDGYYGGSNFLIFDDLTLIPEPSSSLLICLAGLGFVSRRKRA